MRIDKKRLFKMAFDIHNTLKRIPFYPQVYDQSKMLLLWAVTGRRASTATWHATNFCRHYENSALNPAMIVYESFHGSSLACGPAAIYEAARMDPRFAGFKHVLIIDDLDAVSPEIAKRADTRVVDREHRDYSELLATAKYLLNNATFPAWYVRREGQIYVNTWHGTPLKTMFRDEKGAPARFANSQRNFLQASHIILSSDFATQHLLGSAGIASLCATKTWQIGTPRLDRTLAARRAWQPTHAERNILFAPTWKGVIGNANSQHDEITTLISVLQKADGDPIVLHVKAHNFNSEDISDITQLSGTQVTVITVDPQLDINDVMAQMDVVISDYSSLLFDALAADIPVLLFVPDLAVYRRTRGLYCELDTLPLAVCHDGPQLLAALKVARPASAHESATAARETYYPDEDGLATKRVLDVMLDAQGAPKPITQTRKPVIAMMMGAWWRNGITSSALNLLSNIDTDTYDVVVLTDGKNLKEEAWPQIAEAPPQVMFVHRVGPEDYAPPERHVKSIFYHTNALKARDRVLMQRAMRREARRIIGDVRLHAAIEFSGYRRLWVWIMSMMNADQKIIFQHNDLYSEMTTRFPDLMGVFQTYQHYDQIVSVSEETRALNFANLGEFYRASKSLAVPNTLNLPAIAQSAVDELSTITTDGHTYTVIESPSSGNDALYFKAMSQIDPSKTNFMTIGRASGEKNQIMLLHAFKQLLDTQPQSHLYILGAGPLLDEVHDLRDALGLKDHVTMPGFATTAMQLLCHCDCFVLPSLYEGQPMVILEALTLGKPVIVTDIAGSRSALKGGYGHIVQGPVSAQSFTKAMEAFCEGTLTFKPFDAVRYNNQAIASFHKMLEPITKGP